LLHFNDEEWDGEPLDPEPCSKCSQFPCACEKQPPVTCAICGITPCQCEKPLCPECGEAPCICKKSGKIKIKLADGKERTIQHMTATSFWSPDGKPMSAPEYINRLFGDLPEFFKDEDELRKIWSKPDTRKALLESLAEKGYGDDALAEIRRLIDAEKSDLFDVLAYIAFKLTPITRAERVETHKDQIFSQYDERLQAFLGFVLSQYIKEGVGELDQSKLPHLLELKYSAVSDATNQLGDASQIRDAFVGFQKHLYERRPE